MVVGQSTSDRHEQIREIIGDLLETRDDENKLGKAEWDPQKKSISSETTFGFDRIEQYKMEWNVILHYLSLLVKRVSAAYQKLISLPSHSLLLA